MSTKRILLLATLGLAAGVLVARRLRPPKPTVSASPPPPRPAAESRKPALQADAEGYYVPGYGFSVGRFRFAGFSLHPEALVTFAQATSGTKGSELCEEVKITPATVHLRCDYPQVGIVTIEGRFLTRLATTRLDVPVVSAVVTVRAQDGEILYRARDGFAWEAGR